MQDPTTSDSTAAGEPVSARAVADWVREHIRTGRLLPGQRLIEADIVRATGASRGKVREALQRLEAEGLVSIQEFRGATVKRLGLEEIRQIYRARMALEGLAAADFAASDNMEFKRRLQSIQDELNQLEHGGDHNRFARLNDAWHSLIIEGSGNTFVAQFLARLTVPIYRLLFTTFYNAQRIASANADHRIITSAILEGRVADAEAAMRAHINNGLIALTDLNAHFEL